MTRHARTSFRKLLTALMFLAPNIVGVLAFVVFPVVFSIALACTDWDLRRHNMFKSERLSFVGLDNFVRLVFGSHDNMYRFWQWITLQPLEDRDAPFFASEFLRYFGNTLFLMMGIPFAVAGSLVAAILLSKDTRGRGRVFVALLAACGLIASCILLAALGLGATGTVMLFLSLACGTLLLGAAGGSTVYRTLFYMPAFTAGVPTYLLWKKLYAPQTGPINHALQPVLDGVSTSVTSLPSAVFTALYWLLLTLMVVALAVSLRRLRQWWIDGEIGWKALIVPLAVLGIPVYCAFCWRHTREHGWLIGGAAALVAAWHAWRWARRGRDFEAKPNEGLGNALMLALVTITGQFILIGLAAVTRNLPAMAAAHGGLAAPEWIVDYHWAKPSLMIMAFWAAIGSNNMLLYLAALTNVPTELYEAADIDGARRFQRFWHVTWPQLAPTTFFIAVMATIGGLQGGFEMARTMTQGGPAGATTTLSYYIYIEGFETGRLGEAAAISWALFLFVLVITLFNWKFGNRYVND
jgi:multiple sugar transport system permease protein